MTILLRSTILLAALCSAAAPAFAHAHLKSSTPAAGGTVAAAPIEIDLAFSEGVDLKFTGLSVTGPGKQAVATGEAIHGAAGDSTLVVPVTTPLESGTYRVDWHALATDGHKTSGSFGFTVKP